MYLISYICIVAALLVISALLPLTASWRSSKPAASLTSQSTRRRLIQDLPAALRSGEIYLVYQPKLRLRTGTVEGVEALIRWQHRTLGTISRKSLIPLAEERGRIRELTIWVLRQSLSDQADLAERGHPIGIHVNVSASLLSDGDFVRDVCALIGPGAGPIGLEITETALIENSPVALANLHRMIRHGIAISIDDYGSGLSSLAYLKELPAAELKIDKMFISGMTLSHRDPLIVRSTIDLAHALGLSVVAEGVESMATLALLKVMGCDFAQGFLISPPLPIDELAVFLRGDSHRTLLSAATASLSPPTEFWTRIRGDSGHSESAAGAR